MRTVWKPLLVVAGLLLLLTYLLLQRQTPDLVWRARMYEALHAFELHDAELNRDALLVRAGLLTHYDSLSWAIDGLYGALETLQAWGGAVAGEAAARIDPRLAELATAVQQKETLLEYFKTDNALFQTSLMYFMHTGHTLSSQTAARDGAVAAALGTLSLAMLQFVQLPQRAVSDQIEAILSQLPPVLQSEQDFHTLAVHWRLIMGVMPEVPPTHRPLLA